MMTRISFKPILLSIIFHSLILLSSVFISWEIGVIKDDKYIFIETSAVISIQKAEEKLIEPVKDNSKKIINKMKSARNNPAISVADNDSLITIETEFVLPLVISKKYPLLKLGVYIPNSLPEGIDGLRIAISQNILAGNVPRDDEWRMIEINLKNWLRAKNDVIYPSGYSKYYQTPGQQLPTISIPIGSILDLF